MVSTRMKRQQNKRPFNQLREFDTDFMIGQSTHGGQNENINSTIVEITALNSASNTTQFSGSQLVMHTLEKNFTNKVRCEVDSVMTTNETRMHQAVLTATENLVVHRVEIAITSVNTSSRRSVVVVVLEPDEREISGNFEGLQLIVSSRIISHTDLKKLMRIVVVLSQRLVSCRSTKKISPGKHTLITNTFNYLPSAHLRFI